MPLATPVIARSTQTSVLRIASFRWSITDLLNVKLQSEEEMLSLRPLVLA
jgi:hypothetical protein